MKLLKCHIENFGKLSNFDYKFKDGLNTIEEDNGFGKTTFANFIKSMFYGLDTKRTTKALTDRKQYEPWQGGTYGGNIEFEIDGKSYKLERFFGKKESEDTFMLYDLSTNLESKDYSKKIGDEIFKINKEAYERSTFISGQNMETSMNDSINAKLGNILESENDVNTSEEALKILDNAIKNYKKTGGRGEINEKTFEKLKLEKKLEQKKIDEQVLDEKISQNNEIIKEIKQKEEDLAKVKKVLKDILESETKKAKKENYKIFQDNLKDSEEKVKEYEKFFKNGFLEEYDIQTLIEKCLLIEKSESQIKNFDISLKSVDEMESLKKVFDDEDISEEIINNKIDKYKSLSENENTITVNNEKITNLKNEEKNLTKQIKTGEISRLLFCITTITITMIVITSIMRNVTKHIVFDIIVAIMCFAVFIFESISVSRKKKKSEKVGQELKKLTKIQNELKDNEEYDQKDIDKFIDQFSGDEIGLDKVMHLINIKTKYLRYKDLKSSIEHSLERQKEMTQKKEKLEENVRETLLKYFPELTKPYITYAQEIQIKNSEYLKQKQDYEAKLKAKEDYEKTNDSQILEIINETNELSENDIRPEEFNKDEVENQLKIIEEELNKLNEEKNYNRSQIEIMETNLEELNEVEEDLGKVDAEIKQMKEDCDVLEKTKSYLEKAKINFSSHYLGGMQESFIKNLKLISGNDIDAAIDVNLNAQINEMGGNKEIKYFSTGYKDLIYICMRLSLIDSLFEKETPFIILDDPFVNLDKSKIKNAMNLLKNISKKYQIIYFICHDSRG